MHPPGVLQEATCALVTVTCTTGWFDWTLGELWLCPDGLLRRSRGLVSTVMGPRYRPPLRAFDPSQVLELIDADPRNKWITWHQISQATLKRGLIDHSLHLELADGRFEKFLWLGGDGGYDTLAAALPRVLPGRFTLIDRRIG